MFLSTSVHIWHSYFYMEKETANVKQEAFNQIDLNGLQGFGLFNRLMIIKCIILSTRGIYVLMCS